MWVMKTCRLSEQIYKKNRVFYSHVKNSCSPAATRVYMSQTFHKPTKKEEPPGTRFLQKNVKNGG